MTVNCIAHEDIRFGGPSSPQPVNTNTQHRPHLPVTIRRKPFYNPQAAHWVSKPSLNPTDEILAFHQQFAGYEITPLISLPSVAEEIGIRAVYLKDESQRCGLPSFKILGASWATFRAIAAYTKLPLSTDWSILAEASQKLGITLVAATDGNHGRAVAKFARIIGLKSHILVPQDLDYRTVELIKEEGAKITVTDGDYDDTVRIAEDVAERLEAAILVQDTAFEGYEEIPQWIVDGYTTMMSEIEAQLDGKSPDLVVTPVGVGSFAQAVVSYSKAAGRGTRVLAVEPDAAACLYKSLSNGSSVHVKTSNTIISGLNCGTVSTIAWPVLQAGVDVSITISDVEAHEAVEELSTLGVNSGPCGAASLAALRYAMVAGLESLGLTKDSTVVLLSTEGAREYMIPLDVRVSDPVELMQALIRIDTTNSHPSSSRVGRGKVISEYITAWLEHRNIESYWNEELLGRPPVATMERGSDGGLSFC